MGIDIKKISKEDLKNNLFLVSVGSESIPSTDYDIQNCVMQLSQAIDSMDLDFQPSFLVTHLTFSLSSKSLPELKEMRDEINNEIKVLEDEE